MKEGWERKMLKEIGIVQTGTTPKTADKDNYGDYIPFIKPADIDIYNYGKIRYDNDGLSEKGLQAGRKMAGGSILMVCIGATIGKVGFIDRDVSCNQQVNSFTVKKEFFPKFFYYALTTSDFYEQVMKNSAQATLPIINKGKWECLNVMYPKSLSEQKNIVSILDEAFASVAKAKANAEQNLKNAKELFQSYLQSVFENPKDNWEKKKWDDLCHFVRGPFGGSLKKSIFKEEGYVVYEQKHAIHDHFNQLRYFIDEEKFNEMIRFEVKPGDIIMSCSGVTLGKVAIIPDSIRRGIINQALLKLTPKKNVSVHFLKHWLRSRAFQHIIFKYSGGAAIPNVPSAKILKEILIPLPRIEEQIQVVKNIELIYKETRRLETIYQQKLNDLEELKKSVLQRAFNGELKTT